MMQCYVILSCSPSHVIQLRLPDFQFQNMENAIWGKQARKLTD